MGKSTLTKLLATSLSRAHKEHNRSTRRMDKDHRGQSWHSQRNHGSKIPHNPRERGTLSESQNSIRHHNRRRNRWANQLHHHCPSYLDRVNILYPQDMENFHPFKMEIARASILKGILIKVRKYDETINLATHLRLIWSSLVSTFKIKGHFAGYFLRLWTDWLLTCTTIQYHLI